MITVKEFIKSTGLVVKFDNTQGCILEEELPNLFIKFAKLHVQEALKQAYENIEYSYENSSERYVKENSILNAYNIEKNIK